MRGEVGPAYRRAGVLVAVVALALLSACSGSDGDDTSAGATSSAASDTAVPRTPDPAPQVELTEVDKEVWAPGPPDRSRVPVLLYHGVARAEDFADPSDAVYGLDPDQFAKQMTLLDHAGYETITLDEFSRFVNGDEVSLPPHPLLLTFDDARADSWVGGDGILEQLGYNAVMFVDVGRVEDGDPEYLTWDELRTVEESPRWELQLHSGEGHQQIQYGPDPDDFGAYYAYELEDETFDEWGVRVYGDIANAQKSLGAEIPSYQPLAFPPPYGNYGQDGTNDQRIPAALLPWLVGRFGIVFTQDRPLYSTPGEQQPLGRLQVTRDLTGGELHDFLIGKRTIDP
jgi:polysaccharide deacetylase